MKKIASAYHAHHLFLSAVESLSSSNQIRIAAGTNIIWIEERKQEYFANRITYGMRLKDDYIPGVVFSNNNYALAMGWSGFANDYDRTIAFKPMRDWVNVWVHQGRIAHLLWEAQIHGVYDKQIEPMKLELVFVLDRRQHHGMA